MVKLVADKSFTYTKPILDSAGKKTQSKMIFNKREVMVDDVEHIRVDADQVFETDKAHAKELATAGLARAYDPALDDDAVDPTKGDPLA